MIEKEKELRRDVLSAVEAYYKGVHGDIKEWKVGDRIPYAGRIFDESEMLNLAEALCDFWLTSGRFTDELEKKLSSFLGVRFCSLCNSGSSANLLAFAALTSPQLGEKRILPGDEVITTACAFPTTVAPIIQYGAVPVFVDVTLPTYNLDINQLEAALSPKTKAIMAAHTLGNPFDLCAVKKFCDEKNLWLIEDNCDALGARYQLAGDWKYTGTVGHIGTSSFYPPHHITMGEGGAVYTNDLQLSRIINSFRDWGRDCSCPPGQDNTCGGRFNQQYGELPFGYDHKYVYSHFGYNLKATDLQAAIGCAQVEKLPGFIMERQNNWKYLRNSLEYLCDKLILPEATERSEPSWFGFAITAKNNNIRNRIMKHLESNRIQTRMLFAGNIIKQPCFNALRSSSKYYRIVRSLKNTNKIMNDTLWFGVYPGIRKMQMDWIMQVLNEIMNKY